MSCERALVLVEKLVDGEASPDEKRRAEAHLNGCADCREHYRFLTALGTHYRASGPEEPPESYWEHLPHRIQNRIEADRGGRSLFARILAPAVLGWGALTAAVVLVVALTVNVLREDPLMVSEETSAGAASAPVILPPEGDDAVEAQAPAAAPARPAPRVAEEIPRETMDSLRALGYVAGSEDENPAETTSAPAEPLEKTASAEGLESAFADVASDAEDRSAKEQNREQLAQRVGRSETAPAAPTAMAEEQVGLLRARAAVEDCERWRRMLATASQEGAPVVDVRYELARCSIGSLPPDAGDEMRAKVIEDGEAFLALESEGPRADEIRDALRTRVGR